MYPRTAGERPGRPRYCPAHAGNASGQGVSLSVLGAVRAAGISQWLDGLDPVEQNGLGLRDPKRPNLCQPYTASRFGFCQPFSDLLGPLLTFDFLNEYGIFWDFRLGGIGSGVRSPGAHPRACGGYLLAPLPQAGQTGLIPERRLSRLSQA